MGEKRSAWFEVGDDVEGFFEAEVRGVRDDADAVEHQHIEAAKSFHRLGRNCLEIGCVGEIVKTIRNHGQFAVYDLDRRNLKIVADAKWRQRHDRVRNQPRQAAAEMCWLKNVLENSLEVDPSDVVRKYRHRSVAKVEWANVIKTKNVIDVAVRYQNCVEMANIRPESLLSKI